MKETRSRKIAKWVAFVVILGFSLLAIFPIVMVVTTAFKTDLELGFSEFHFLPQHFSLENFQEAMAKGDWIRYFMNSGIVTIITVTGSLFFNTVCGYGLARLKFKGRNVIMMLFMIGMMIPPQAYIVPQFIMLRKFPLMNGNNIFGQGGYGLLNTYAGLIIPMLCGSFGVFLSRQFYITFPKELDEAATIDGCSKFAIYTKIYVPLSKTLFATLTILKFVSTWNDFFYPLIITNDKAMYTVQLGLQIFHGNSGIEWNVMMAATLITILPIIVVFVGAQKYLIKGIVTTGLKN